MPPLNHLPGSRVRSVIGKALIIEKVTALPEHSPPPPCFCTLDPLILPDPLVPDHWTEYEGLGCSGFGHAKLIRSLWSTTIRGSELLLGPGHRDIALFPSLPSSYKHKCYSLASKHTGLFVMPLTRFPHESLSAFLSLFVELGLAQGRERRLGENRQRERETGRVR